MALPFLSSTYQPKVVVANPISTMAKIAAIKQDGLSALEVVADFDRTLTTHFNSEGVAQSSYYMLYESGVFPTRFSESCEVLFKKYYPIETDPHLSIPEKMPHMSEWWNKIHQMLLAEGVTKEKLKKCAEQTKSRLREGTREFFDTLYKHNIPLVILSAGLGDMIHAFLQHHAIVHPNTNIISNMMEFDPQTGLATAFIGQPMTTFNKSETAYSNAVAMDRAMALPSAPNVLLIGDALSDLAMVDPKAHKTVLSIGFLSANVEANRERYAQAFDIVILNDGPMGPVNDLLKELLRTSRT